MKKIYILINLLKAVRIYPMQLFQSKNPATFLLVVTMVPAITSWFYQNNGRFEKFRKLLKTESVRLTLPKIQQ